MGIASRRKPFFWGIAVDIVTRRKKQQDLMIRAVERRVRERAQQLYEEGGQVEGQALKDWVQAETEILDATTVAPLYRRLKAAGANSQEEQPEKDGRAAEVPAELVPESQAVYRELV